MKQRLRHIVDRLVAPYLQQFEKTQRASALTQITQKALFAQYQQAIAQHSPLPRIDDVGFRVYSQFDEDGIFVYLFAVVGFGTRRFVDIGASDGINSNCANLALHFGLDGLFIDGNEAAIERGQRFYAEQPNTLLHPPILMAARVTRENVNDLLISQQFEGDIDLLSIDIDGNDYWVWDAITCVQPRVVCIETHIQLGLHNIVVPYDPDYRYPPAQAGYMGASPVAMAALARRKGYRLVATNSYGFNAIFLRNDLAPDLIPEKPVEYMVRHRLNAEQAHVYEAVKHLPFVEG